MMWSVLIIFAVLAGTALLLRMRQSKPWLFEYFRFKLTHPRLQVRSGEPVHVMFLYVDHFEPKENTRDPEAQRARMRQWLESYPAMASRHRDADGIPPRHTWFYLVEEWETQPEDLAFLQQLARLTYDGFGEVELHVHHGPGWHLFPEIDTAEKLEAQIERLQRFYRQTGALLTAASPPQLVYGFIHGKWALDNSAQGLYCGVDQELEILRRTGCYADFTMPSGHGSTQSRKINAIYYAPTRRRPRKGHDWGEDVRAGTGLQPRPDQLMIFQGMIEVYLRRLFSSQSVVEKSNLDFHDLPTPARMDQWVGCNIHVPGRPDWVFVKVHTHGAREENFPVCFGDHAEAMHSYLEQHYNDGSRFQLHYVTAREAYNIVKAAEAGRMGNPAQYRDFLIAPYANRVIKTNACYELEHWQEQSIAVEILPPRSGPCEFEFQGVPLQRLEVQDVSQFTVTWDQGEGGARLRLRHTGRPQVALHSTYGDLVVETSSSGVARIVRSAAGAPVEETLLVEGEEIVLDLAVAPATLDWEATRLGP